jgi:prepilin-type N-terminal cleavage/methylation domain-containing protein
MMILKTRASIRSKTDFRTLARQAQRGFTMIELMIGIVLGLLIMVALSQLYVNITRTNSEMAKTNAQIENGRFAIQLLGGDIGHGGFWGGYVPKFDDLTVPATGYDGTTMAPSAVPDPCLAYASWDAAYRNNLLAIPVQSYESAPAACAAVVANQKAGTDVLVVRHVETCLPGVGDCEVDTAGKLYFQAPQCEDEISAAVQAATATTVTLPAFASPVNDFYLGSTIRIISGPGSYQSRLISAYDGATKVATLSVAWTTMPNNTSSYTFGDGYVLDTGGYVFHKKNCTTVADKRKFISSIYYVRDYAVTAGDGIPTLVRSRFDLSGGVLAHQPAEALIEGIEGFRVEFAIDGIGDAGTVVDYTQPVVWSDPLTRVAPMNRGDGIPDVRPDGTFSVRCTTAAPCTESQLANAVVVKLYVLARNRESTVGYVDGKTYTLGTTTLGPFNDQYKRHVFSTSVRLTNISGRRETP